MKNVTENPQIYLSGVKEYCELRSLANTWAIVQEEMIFGLSLGHCKMMWSLHVQDAEIVCRYSALYRQKF